MALFLSGYKLNVNIIRVKNDRAPPQAASRPSIQMLNRSSQQLA